MPMAHHREQTLRAMNIFKAMAVRSAEEATRAIPVIDFAPAFRGEPAGLETAASAVMCRKAPRMLRSSWRPRRNSIAVKRLTAMPIAATNMTTTTTRLGIGGRIAGGLEIKINGHLSVQGDLGYEHFFFVDDHFEADVFVPTLGVIGRL